MTKLNKIREVAIISGGAGYLGSAISQKLSDSGFVVIAISKDETTTGKENEYIRRITADITDENSMEKIAKEIEKQFGKISTIIHSASAPLIRKPVLSESVENFELQFKVNVTGAFNLFKFFIPLLSSNGSVIGITTKSIVNDAPHSPSGSYIPAKLALNGLLRVISCELKEKSIRVYGVAPAFMPGGLNNDIPQTVAEFIKKKSLPEEITNPENVADIILELINDKTKKMDGKSIIVPNRKLINL